MSDPSDCKTPPCPLDETGRQDADWRRRWRAHAAQHSDRREEIAMYVRMMEREFKRATGGKGRWE